MALRDVEINANKLKGRRQASGVLKQFIVSLRLHESVYLLLAQCQAVFAIAKELELFVEEVIFWRPGIPADAQQGAVRHTAETIDFIVFRPVTIGRFDILFPNDLFVSLCS